MTQNSLTLVSSESMGMVISEAPEVLKANQISCNRCNEFGAALYEKVCEQGMNDELDTEVANYIERTRKTVKAMNERRSSVTKIFDAVRAEFTSIENKIDPSKVGSIAYNLQLLRNEYAKKKHEEEERKRREQMMAAQRTEEMNRAKSVIEEHIRHQISAEINVAIREIEEWFASITEENQEEISQKIRSVGEDLGKKSFVEELVFPSNFTSLTNEEFISLCRKVYSSIYDSLCEQYKFEVSSTKEHYLSQVAGKVKMLKEMKEADAENAAKLKSEQEELERRQREQQEEERRQREEQQKREVESKQKLQEMDSLFSAAQANVQTELPKVKVSKTIVLKEPKGILPIFSFWWSREGCNLSSVELKKMFKKQIAFCERLANKTEELIVDDAVEYLDNIIAK